MITDITVNDMILTRITNVVRNPAAACNGDWFDNQIGQSWQATSWKWPVRCWYHGVTDDFDSAKRCVHPGNTIGQSMAGQSSECLVCGTNGQSISITINTQFWSGKSTNTFAITIRDTNNTKTSKNWLSDLSGAGQSDPSAITIHCPDFHWTVLCVQYIPWQSVASQDSPWAMTPGVHRVSWSCAGAKW